MVRTILYGLLAAMFAMNALKFVRRGRIDALISVSREMDPRVFWAFTGLSAALALASGYRFLEAIL